MKPLTNSRLLALVVFFSIFSVLVVCTSSQSRAIVVPTWLIPKGSLAVLIRLPSEIVIDVALHFGLADTLASHQAPRPCAG